MAAAQGAVEQVAVAAVELVAGAPASVLAEVARRRRPLHRRKPLPSMLQWNRQTKLRDASSYGTPQSAGGAARSSLERAEPTQQAMCRTQASGEEARPCPAAKMISDAMSFRERRDE